MELSQYDLVVQDGYKLNAVKRILLKYGAYAAHTTQLSEDKTVKASDQAKLKGYLN